MKRKFVAMLIVLAMVACLFPASAFAETTNETALGKGYVTGISVNMRSSPSTSGTPLAKVYKPDVVSILNTAIGGGYDWYYVRMLDGGSMGKVGYIAQNYVNWGTTTERWRISAPSGANLRSGPGTNYRSDGLLLNGTTLMILDDVWNSSDGYTWFYVLVTSGTHQGYWGYVRYSSDIVSYS